MFPFTTSSSSAWSSPTSTFLDSSQGYLPIWLNIVASVALLNSVTNFFSASASHKVYSSEKGKTQATPLAGRVFATWNLTSALIRFYAAQDINSKSAYELAMLSFVVALIHFGSEVVGPKTIQVKGVGSLAPFVVAAGSLVAMATQYKHYVA